MDGCIIAIISTLYTPKAIMHLLHGGNHYSVKHYFERTLAYLKKKELNIAWRPQHHLFDCVEVTA